MTEPYKPVLDRIVASADMLVYVSQTSRGELLVGAEIERYNTLLDALDLLVPGRVRVARDRSAALHGAPADPAPVDGRVRHDPRLLAADGADRGRGLLRHGGWGTWGFKAVPAGGMGMAELVATGKVPEMIAPFADRPLPRRPRDPRSQLGRDALMGFKLDCPNCGLALVPRVLVRRRAAGLRPGQLGGGRLRNTWLRANVAGPQQERWFHFAGCRRWLTVERDTRDNALRGEDT